MNAHWWPMRSYAIIILVKYIRHSHEIIRINTWTPTATVNRKLHKNKYINEMTWFWIRIVIWSSLHEPIQIPRSFRVSVFELPVYRVHNGHKFESSVTGPDLSKWVCNRCNTHPNKWTHTNIHLYTYTPIHTIIHTIIHIYTLYIHSHTPPCTHTHPRKYTHLNSNTQAHHSHKHTHYYSNIHYTYSCIHIK